MPTETSPEMPIVGARARVVEPMIHRFVFGGVAFEISTAPALRWQLAADHARFQAPFEDGPVAASVRVAATSVGALPHAPREVVYAWSDRVATVRTNGLRVDVRELGPGSFAASALVGEQLGDCGSLCTALAGALVDRVGGLVLHASGIELAGGAVLFVGPSGAGKTTAANHCEGARAFAKDRAAVYPTEAGWFAAPMAGGDEIDLPDAEQRVLPLHAILRVERERDAVVVEECDPVRAVRVLRESAQLGGRDPVAEGALLDRLLTVAAQARVGVIHTRLGEPIVPGLLPFLERTSAWI